MKLKQPCVWSGVGDPTAVFCLSKEQVQIIPGCSFGRKNMPDLNPAKFRRIPKKNAGDLKKHPDPRFYTSKLPLRHG